jgi:Cys-tRNA synthase (O-phospho-L-seryl-tRNA:Cys-tRNA synthase)
MEDSYYKQLADSIFENISERIHRSPLVMQVMHEDVEPDAIDAGAAAEIIDSIHLSELAAAMNGNYAMARMTLNGLQHNFEVFIAASKYYKLSQDQVSERIRGIFVDTVSNILQQLDSK